jgi:hypothetical protein
MRYLYVRHLMQIAMRIESIQLLIVCISDFVVLISCASPSRLYGLESELVYLLRNLRISDISVAIVPGYILLLNMI